MTKKITYPIFGLIFFSILLGATIAASEETYSEETITGNSEGNHELDCTIIRPWDSGGPQEASYPVIVWTNGWGGNNVAGETTTLGYKPGLIEWAVDGPYIVIAANAWSPRNIDALKCLQWIADQNQDSQSDYYGVVNLNKIGLAGHSQGGGAAIKAGNGEPNGFDITAVVAMNPYGPNWNKAADQDGPMMLLGGTNDSITPVSSFLAVWEAMQTNGEGGILAVLDGGGHSDDAYGPDDVSALTQNFARFQSVTNLWWQYHLNDDLAALPLLEQELNEPQWDTQFSTGELSIYLH